mgnify:CR=1 FL=1
MRPATYMYSPGVPAPQGGGSAGAPTRRVGRARRPVAGTAGGGATPARRAADRRAAGALARLAGRQVAGRAAPIAARRFNRGIP